MGSSLGRRFGFQSRDIKVLLGCGTAAGIAATFNAPLGGVLFAMELILPEFSTHAFIPVVISTVLGVTVGNLFLGDQATFLVQEFAFVSPWELGIYLVLGIVCGLGGVGFIRSLERAQDLVDRSKVPYWAMPALGGLLVGILGLLVFQMSGLGAFGGASNYHVFGTGYSTVNAILRGDTIVLAAGLLLLLVIVKPLASSITLGSGGGGGVFSASLFQGAVLGALVGLVAHELAPMHTAPASAYALVGMGAFYAATGRATLTTIVLMTELTDGYSIVLPIMFAAVTADAISVGLSRDSIYTIRLERRGIHFEHDRTQNPLDTMQVRDAMSTQVDTLSGETHVGEAFNAMIDKGHTGFPVVDGNGALLGVVTRRDIGRWLHDGRGHAPLAEVVSGLLITVFPDNSLHEARDRMFSQEIGRLLVVDPQDRRRLVGILTRSDLLRAQAAHDVEASDMWSDEPQGSTPLRLKDRPE
jgi:CIC family chloride channel protein